MTFSMERIYFHERKGRHQEEHLNLPHLVMIEHRFGRGWAYRVPSKGVHKEANWLPKRTIQDLDNKGLQDMRVIVATDQPAIVDVQVAMHAPRPNRIIPINSPVGESESNGRAEDFIRRVQEKVRTLRHHGTQIGNRDARSIAGNGMVGAVGSRTHFQIFQRRRWQVTV